MGREADDDEQLCEVHAPMLPFIYTRHLPKFAHKLERAASQMRAEYARRLERGEPRE